MMKQFLLARFLLWLFVITIGIELGAGLYETLVVLPLWASAPPDSVIAFYKHNAANPQFALNAGGKFWMFLTPFVGLTAIAALLSGLRTHSQHRKWRIAGTTLSITVVAFTFAWFVPNIIKLTSQDVLTMSADEVRNLANWWTRLNWLRIFLVLTAWLCALRATGLSTTGELSSKMDVE